MGMRSKPSCLRAKIYLREAEAEQSSAVLCRATWSIAFMALPLSTGISTLKGKAICSNTFWVLPVPPSLEMGTSAVRCQLHHQRWQGETPKNMLVPSHGHHTGGWRARRAAHQRHLPSPTCFLLPEVPPVWREGDELLPPAQPADPRQSSRTWLR